MKTPAEPVTRTLLAPIAIGLLIPVRLLRLTLSRGGIRRSLVAVVLGLIAPSVMAGGCDRCGGDKPPPPLPPTPPEPSKPDTSLEIEDAGEDASDAADGDGSDGKKAGGPPAASMSKCCAAIQQNAENAPEPTKSYMKQTAAACYAAVKSGQSAASIIALAKGAGVSCK